MFALMEQVGSGLDRHLGAPLEDLGKLAVGEAVEDPQRPDVGEPHQIVVR